MNAPLGKVAPATHVIPASDVLEIRAQIRAFLWWQYHIEIDEAVDELQAYAERSGLVRELGQDRVQEIMAAPFARYRKMIEPDDGPPDWFANTIMVEPNEPEPLKPAAKQTYHTPKSTIDAFMFVASLNDADHLTRWLAQHPLDAPELHKIWENKCSRAPK
jgi:hypothetical protein